MRRIEAEALVGASRDEVWDLYDDIAGEPRWMPGVRSVLYVSGPARVGTVYREQTRVFGFPATAQWEVVEHRRPTLQVRETADAWMRRTLTLTFEGRGTGTRVHHELVLRSRLWGPLGWLHEQLAAAVSGAELHAIAAGAKRAFEGDPPR
jgi:Polyketide cyclase / dehydrase and lipid transport